MCVPFSTTLAQPGFQDAAPPNLQQFRDPILQAPDIKNITSAEAQGLKGPVQEVEVWAGTGTNISFIPMNETIQKVWLGDPSGLTFDLDSPLCGSGQQTGDCKESNAMVINLRAIQRLKFPNLPQAQTTLLSIVTKTIAGERKLYHFRVSPIAGQPEYAAVIVNPDADASLINLGSNRKVALEAVEQGLQVAKSQGLISANQRNEALQAKVTNFIALVRNGTKPPEAAQKAGVSLALITRLAELGSQSAPSSAPSLSPPSNIQQSSPPLPVPQQPLPPPVTPPPLPLPGGGTS
jgi:hypothetical protein